MELSHLNPPQYAAVTAPDGPILVLAGPGSGKTRVLTHRIAYLIQERAVAPWNIIAVTFTNKAAAEMRERAEKLIGGKVRGLKIGTFHALCARLLRQTLGEKKGEVLPYDRNFVIYDTDDQLQIMRAVVADEGIDLKRLRLNSPNNVLYRVSDAKNELITPKEYPNTSYQDEVVARLYEHYQMRLTANNAMDFDDLIMNMVVMLRRHPDIRAQLQQDLAYVLVDEFQDTNMAQYELVRLWSAPQNNIFVVGDEDQAIYAFRGADYRNVRRFREDYPVAKTILLEQNYRSTQVVLDAARAVISENVDRTPKSLFTDRKGGAKIYAYEAYDDREEAGFVVKEIERLRIDGIPLDEIAVMYRTNAQSRQLEDALKSNRIPYRLVGGIAFYQRREIKDVMAYLRMVALGADEVSFNRIINIPKRGIGPKTQATFEAWANGQGLSLDDALVRIANGVNPPGITGKTLNAFATLGSQLRDWHDLATQERYVDLLDAILIGTGYLAHLAGVAENELDLDERKANLEQLKAVLSEPDFESLADLLTDATLTPDSEATESDNTARVTLLTLHASKGLEYRAVFITGLEEKLLPHSRSIDDLDGIAEERRLLYVGITRARDKLYLTHAFRRRFGNYSEPSEASRFLYNLPATLIEGTNSLTASQQQITSYNKSMQWNAPSSREPQERAYVPPKPKAKPDPKIVPFPKPSKYRSGQRVLHSKFGEGIVIESKRNGDDEEVVVAFEEEGVGIKRLMASFANLQMLAD
ncbi:MAG: ATP-dependent helicase [Phototrophicaceae bacterium]